MLESPENGFLKNDSIVLRYNIELITWQGGLSINRLGRQPRPALPEVPASLGPNLGALLKAGDRADVSIHVGPRTFHAHHVILTARSKVFRAMLDGPMKEGLEGRVTVAEVEPEVFGALLHFIYTDDLPEELAEGGLDAAMAQHLLMAADRFQVPRLRRICEQRLLENLDVDTVCTTAAIADHNKAAELKRRCLEFIAQNLPLVMKSASFQDTVAGNSRLMAEILEVVAMNGHLPQPPPGATPGGGAGPGPGPAMGGGVGASAVSTPQGAGAPQPGALAGGPPAPRGGFPRGPQRPAPQRPVAMNRDLRVNLAPLPPHAANPEQPGARTDRAAAAAPGVLRNDRGPPAGPLPAGEPARWPPAAPGRRPLLEEDDELFDDDDDSIVAQGRNFVADEDDGGEVNPRGVRREREREDGGQDEDGTGPDGRRVRARREGAQQEGRDRGQGVEQGQAQEEPAVSGAAAAMV